MTVHDFETARNTLQSNTQQETVWAEAIMSNQQVHTTIHQKKHRSRQTVIRRPIRNKLLCQH